jgi:hypothetical protein
MANGNRIRGGDSRPDRGVETSFDDLAKGLGSGAVSRRKALRWMGGALVGAALTAIPGVAWAKPKPGKCSKDAQCPTGQVCVNGSCACQSGTTLCGGACVPVCTPPKELNACECTCPNGCPENQIQDPTTCECRCPELTCPGTGQEQDPETCQCRCPGDEELCASNNTCMPPCPAGETRNPTTCLCEGSLACPDQRCGNYYLRCHPEGPCVCLQTAEGGGFCYAYFTATPCGAECNTSLDCGSGQVCVVETCCQSSLRGVCLPTSSECSLNLEVAAGATASEAPPSGNTPVSPPLSAAKRG